MNTNKEEGKCSTPEDLGFFLLFYVSFEISEERICSPRHTSESP